MKFLQQLSKDITEDKYLKEGESVRDMFKGVSIEVASCEKPDKREQVANTFFDMMNDGFFIPGGRILANARPHSPMKQYNNCFTIDIEDSMESITGSLSDYMQILKTGGGVGDELSKIRPKGTPLSVGGVSSGPMSFLEVFDVASKTIRAGNRRGASIAILRCDHPDIMEFIEYKRGDENGKLTQFNISVGITDKFMEAVEADADWDLIWEGKVFETIKAKKIYDAMAEHAFFYNEPGALFLDTIERYNNGYWAFTVDRCNPCGEIVMPAYSLCCLGALNLTKFVSAAFTNESYFDLHLFEEKVRLAVRFLDNILTVTDYPLDRIEEFSKLWRRIGLGFTGLGDALAMLKVRYGSEDSIELCEEIARTLRDSSYLASVELAKEKGAFPSCDIPKLLEATFIKELPKGIRDGIAKYGMRNIALNTVAPTGTTSIALGQNCSSGIEPIFSLEYERKVRIFSDKDVEDTFKFEKVMDYGWLTYCSLSENFGKEVEVPDFFPTTEELTGVETIAMQSVWQKYIDHSISKTFNLPSKSKVDSYTDLFKLAWKAGLKGFTSFNPDGAMASILSNKPQVKEDTKIERHHAPKRPKELPCDIREVSVAGTKLLVLVGLLDGEPYEVFCTTNDDKDTDVKSHRTGTIKKIRKGRYDLFITNGEEKLVAEDIGNTFDENFRSIARLISGMLRHGADIKFVIDQLNKTPNITSFQKAVSRVLKNYLEDGEIKTYGEKPKCDICETELQFKEGCLSCPSCGWSKCS